MNNETVGISTVIVGVIIVVGAVRGTWKKIFNDVISTGSNGGSMSRSSRGGSSGPSIGGFPIPSIPIPGIPSPSNPVPASPIKLCWKGPIPYPCGLQFGPFSTPTLSYTNPGTSFPQSELIGANGQGVVIY